MHPHINQPLRKGEIDGGALSKSAVDVQHGASERPAPVPPTAEASAETPPAAHPVGLKIEQPQQIKD